MAENYCKPYGQCGLLDGQILINQTLQGPAVTLPSRIDIADVNGKPLLRPYCRFIYRQQWIPQDACMSLPTNIIGLAPGETMTLEIRQVEKFDFTRMVQDAVETSEVVTTSGPASQMRDREGFDSSDGIWLATRYVEKFGSFWETVGEIGGAIVGAAVGGPIGAGLGAWVGGAVGGWLGGDDEGGSGTGNSDTLNDVDQVLESISHSESRRTVTETTTSRSSSYERTTARTFVNPYRDRSLQLRFIPVFRKFRVVTTFYRFQHGYVLELTQPQFKNAALSARLGDFIQRLVTDPRIVSVAASELGLQDDLQVRKKSKSKSVLTDHLNANSEFYAKRYLRYLYARRDMASLQPAVQGVIQKAAGKEWNKDMESALIWSRMQVNGKSLYVPLADEHVATSALNMKDKERKTYADALGRIGKARLKLTRERDVNVFIGTHIEPAAGTCVLEGIVQP